MAEIGVSATGSCSSSPVQDHLCTGLDIIVVGINPGVNSTKRGHHYGGPGNHFWKCMFLSGLTPEKLTCERDAELLGLGIGLTNLVERTTRTSSELTKTEMQQGTQVLRTKLATFQPKIVAFNGIVTYEFFSSTKGFDLGLQEETFKGMHLFVMPSSSPRCSSYPRAEDKLKFYNALRALRDFVRCPSGQDIDKSQLVFHSQSPKKRRREAQTAAVSSTNMHTETETSAAASPSKRTVVSKYFIPKK